MATSTIAILQSDHTFVTLEIDPPFLDENVYVMTMRRYRQRNDQIFGHIHFTNRRLISSASIVKGPPDIVCYLERGWGMGLEYFDLYNPFNGYAHSGFITCLVRDSTWRLDD